MKGLRLFALLGVLSALPVCTMAQQPQPTPTPKKIPTLRTEDVLPHGTVVDEVESPAGAKKPDGAKPSVGKGEKAAAEKPEVSPEEQMWRDNIKEARQRAESAERSAEEAELKITDLRNQLNTPGRDPRDRNAIVAEMGQQAESAKQLRDEAKQAKEELRKIEEDGRDNGYKEEAGPAPTTEGGKPNEQYYRERFEKLTQAAQDAQRRIQLYEDRVRDLNQRITNNSRTGDNYFIGRLQEDLSEAQKSLQEAQEAYDKSQADLDALKEEGRTAGVPPGVFR